VTGGRVVPPSSQRQVDATASAK